VSKEPLSDMPAFPATREMRGSWAASGGAGMTMRQYYKALVLQGWAAGRNRAMLEDSNPESVAEQCGRYADAALKEDEEHATK